MCPLTPTTKLELHPLPPPTHTAQSAVCSTTPPSWPTLSRVTPPSPAGLTCGTGLCGRGWAARLCSLSLVRGGIRSATYHHTIWALFIHPGVESKNSKTTIRPVKNMTTNAKDLPSWMSFMVDNWVCMREPWISLSISSCVGLSCLPPWTRWLLPMCWSKNWGPCWLSTEPWATCTDDSPKSWMKFFHEISWGPHLKFIS